MGKTKRILKGVAGVVVGLALWFVLHQAIGFLLEAATKIPVLGTLRFYQAALLWVSAALPGFASINIGGRVAERIGESAKIFAWIIIALYALEIILTFALVGFASLFSTGLIKTFAVKWFVGIGCAAELI